MKPIVQDLEIQQGATFDCKLQWCSADAVHKVISQVQVGLPTLVTASGHGLTATGPVWITSVRGPSDINTDGYRDCPPRTATVVDADTLAIDFDSGLLPAYQSGGVLTYYPPLDLTGYTARMQVRPSVGSATVLIDLSTDAGGIVIDAANGIIERRLEASATAALTWSLGVYDLELTAPDGFTVRLATGRVTVSPEVTR